MWRRNYPNELESSACPTWFRPRLPLGSGEIAATANRFDRRGRARSAGSVLRHRLLRGSLDGPARLGGAGGCLGRLRANVSPASRASRGRRWVRRRLHRSDRRDDRPHGRHRRVETGRLADSGRRWRSLGRDRALELGRRALLGRRPHGARGRRPEGRCRPSSSRARGPPSGPVHPRGRRRR